MKSFRISQSVMDQMVHHVEREYPSEACGFILVSKDGLMRAESVENVQDHYHAKDPEQFPRTSRSAYFMDPVVLLKIQKKTRTRQANSCISA